MSSLVSYAGDGPCSGIERKDSPVSSRKDDGICSRPSEKIMGHTSRQSVAPGGIVDGNVEFGVSICRDGITDIEVATLLSGTPVDGRGIVGVVDGDEGCDVG